MKREPFNRLQRGRLQLYIDLADWWIGIYFGDDATYYCLLTVVLRVAK